MNKDMARLRSQMQPIVSHRDQSAERLQRSLNAALRYFLYGSFVSGRSYWRSFGLEQLRAKPLRQVIEAFSLIDGWDREWPERLTTRWISHATFARNLALANVFWAEILEQKIRQPFHSGQVPHSKSYQSWCHTGGGAERYRPVHALRERLLSCNAADMFLRSIVHGSVATLDDTPGFSDLDLAFVVRRAVLVDPTRLIRLRRVAAKVLTSTYAFDPFMHHGPYYLSEIDLVWYPEAMFPLVLFENAFDLLDPEQELAIATRPSEDVTDAMLEAFESFFRSKNTKFAVKNYYDLERILGSAMLLPALYLQRCTGQFRYKRDTFPLAQKDFSVCEWQPIRKATELRGSLTERPKPPARLVALANRIGAPGLVQWWALCNPRSWRVARKASRKLGSDYPQQVLRLIASMHAKQNIHPKTAVATDLSEKPATNHFQKLVYGPFTEMPKRIPIERYQAALELLVNRWSGLPRAPLAIYQLGQVGAPGISDLDFIIVFPRGQMINWSDFRPEAFPHWVQELLLHPPYMCDDEAWTQLPAWYPIFDLRHLWGKRLAVPVPSKELQTGCALGMLVDYLMVKLPRAILYLSWKRPLRVKTLLCVLHSVKYTMRLAEQAGISIPSSATQVISEVNQLRGSWFDLLDDERMSIVVSLCTKVCQSVGDLFDRVEHALCRQEKFGATVGELTDRNETNKYQFYFDSIWTMERSIQCANEQFTARRRFIWPLPESFAQVLAIYGDECPDLQKHLHSLGCFADVLWDAGGWNSGLRLHARAMVAYADSACLLGVPLNKYIAFGYSTRNA